MPKTAWWISGKQTWKLRSGVKMHRNHPDTFQIPSDEEKAAIQPGDFVKLMFDAGDHGTERMWVKVTSLDPLAGTLANSPFGIPDLSFGDHITFAPKHIICIEDVA